MVPRASFATLEYTIPKNEIYSIMPKLLFEEMTKYES